MSSKESQIAAQVRLRQRALEIQDCQNRPENMTVNEWCEQHNITKANYYWRLKQVRKAFLEQMDVQETGFVELPAPVETVIQQTSSSKDFKNHASTAAVLHTTGGISIELREGATADFIKNLIGAVVHA